MTDRQQLRSLTPVLLVDAIEPCLDFWTERLGFQRVAEVPHGDRLGFVILVRDGVQVMYQTWDSLTADVPALAREPRGRSATLYLKVADVDAVDRALADVERVCPRRTTFYGADEVIVREPGGTAVFFAQLAD